MNGIKVNFTILPENKIIEGDKNGNILEILNKNNLEIDAFCGGNGNCGKCKARLVSGKISSITETEKDKLTITEIENNIFLACQRNILEDSRIEIKNNNVNNATKSYTCNKTANIDSIIKKEFISLEKVSMENQTCDMDRIIDNLNNRKEYDNIQIDYKIIPKISNILRETNDITITLFDNKVINIEKWDIRNKNYAIAVDVGTTTIACYLIDLNNGDIISTYACYNPQKKYGQDVISRINFSLQKDENLQELNSLVIDSVNESLEELIIKGNISKEHVNLICFVGNTTMSHILMNCNLGGIAKAPFAPCFTKNIVGNIKDLGIDTLHENAKFIILPNIGGYVGSDTLGVAIGTDILNKKGNWLAIDIGTNCEIILKTDTEIYACSTAAGPAFEGSNMSCGMRAQSGAIYSVSMEENIDLSTIDNKEPIGICGSGYIDIVANLINQKIIKKQGRILPKEKLDHISDNIKDKISKADKGLKIVLNEKNNVFVSQEDISNLQLAKGAIKGAINILLKKAQVDELEGIFIAGTFGSNLNIENLNKLKMIPSEKVKDIKVMGNAAASGAIDAILNKSIYENILEIQSKIQHVELAMDNDFQQEFILGTMF